MTRTVIVLSDELTSADTARPKVIEAMASRKPVIVTRTLGAAVALIDGGHVVGVMPGDPRELRAAIRELLHDRARADAQADRGYRLALERFDSDDVVEEIVRLLHSIVPGSRPEAAHVMR